MAIRGLIDSDTGAGVSDSDSRYVKPDSESVYTGWHRVTASTTRINDYTFTVTNDTTNQTIFKIGRPLRYANNIGGWRYGQVTSYEDGTVTLRGAPMIETYNNYVEAGDMSKATQVDFFISGAYGDGVDGALLYNDANSKFYWKLGRAYCVEFSAFHKVADTSTQPKINLIVNIYPVSTDNTNNGIELSTAGVKVDNSATGIETSSYAINAGEIVEVSCHVAGGTGDAEHLTVSATFILE